MPDGTSRRMQFVLNVVLPSSELQMPRALVTYSIGKEGHQSLPNHGSYVHHCMDDHSNILNIPTYSREFTEESYQMNSPRQRPTAHQCPTAGVTLFPCPLVYCQRKPPVGLVPNSMNAEGTECCVFSVASSCRRASRTLRNSFWSNGTSSCR